MSAQRCPCGWELPCGMLAIRLRDVADLLASGRHPKPSDAIDRATMIYYCPVCDASHLQASDERDAEHLQAVMRWRRP